MGGVILNLLVQLAIRFGMAWLAHKFPWLKPEETALIQTHLDTVKTSKKSLCEGLACPADLKRDA